MRSSGYMLGKHPLNSRGFPNALVELHGGEAPTILNSRGFPNALAGENDGEAPTK